MKKPVVIVVEDNVDLQRHLKLFLTKNGIECVLSSNEKEAIEKVTGDIPAIIADIDLSEAGGEYDGGINLAKMLTEKKLDIPVILISQTPQIHFLNDDNKETLFAIDKYNICAIYDRNKDNFGEILINKLKAIFSKEINETLDKKIKSGEYDVFLCHNSEDKKLIKEIGLQLKDQDILPWLDEWELQPGLPWQNLLEQQISRIKSAAVFVGKQGIGPWQEHEMNAFLREFVKRGCPVIPVLLSDATKTPELPIFLNNMTWVDFRNKEHDPIKRLIWGITGKKPK